MSWIKYHRSIKNHWIYELNRPRTFLEAWNAILLEVNFSSKKVLIKGQLIDCDKGQSLNSLQTWANLFNWSIAKVRHFFDLLKKDEMITLEGLQYTTRLTVCNWDVYQGEATDEKQTEDTTENITKRRPNATTKEGKEGKEGKEKKCFTPPSLEEVQKYFIEKGDSVEGATKAFEYYEAADWHDSNGNKVKNWKQKMIGSWFKPKNQKQATLNGKSTHELITNTDQIQAI